MTHKFQEIRETIVFDGTNYTVSWYCQKHSIFQFKTDTSHAVAIGGYDNHIDDHGIDSV